MPPSARQGRFPATVLRRVQHHSQIGARLQDRLNGGITQEFPRAETVFGDHRVRLEVHPEHLPSLVPQGFGVDEAAHDPMQETIGRLKAGDQELLDALLNVARQE